MRCTDFEYDGQLLSDYGFIICDFGDGAGTETVSVGSPLNLNTIQMPHLNKFKVMSTQYGEAYSVTFQIAKTEDLNAAADTLFLDEYELSRLIRWLNRKEFHKFKAIYADGEHAKTYYMGTFNVQTICLRGNVIGLELTLQTNAPFGYYEPVEYEMTLSDTADGCTICDTSDEIGYIYPDIVEIECLGSGDLTVSNSNDTRQTIIRNCAKGEVITLYGETKQIASSMEHQKLCNDFNYSFIRIINRRENGNDESSNTFTASLPCRIRLVYSPISKGKGVI